MPVWDSAPATLRTIRRVYCSLREPGDYGITVPIRIVKPLWVCCTWTALCRNGIGVPYRFVNLWGIGVPMRTGKRAAFRVESFLWDNCIPMGAVWRLKNVS